MSVVEQSERHRITDIHEYGVDTKNFVIYLQGVEEGAMEDGDEPGVEYRMANRFIKNLDILTGQDDKFPIIISMKTCGGEVEEGMAMYDAIKAAPNPIVIVNYTHARSMSSIILQAANKRVMMPHSSFMVHMGDEAFFGTVKQVRTNLEWGKKFDADMFNAYVEAVKRSSHGKMYNWSRIKIEKWLREQMDAKEDVFFTAIEAIEYGFADEVFSTWESVTDFTPEQLARKSA